MNTVRKHRDPHILSACLDKSLFFFLSFGFLHRWVMALSESINNDQDPLPLSETSIDSFGHNPSVGTPHGRSDAPRASLICLIGSTVIYDLSNHAYNFWICRLPRTDAAGVHPHLRMPCSARIFRSHVPAYLMPWSVRKGQDTGWDKDMKIFTRQCATVGCEVTAIILPVSTWLVYCFFGAFGQPLTDSPTNLRRRSHAKRSSYGAQRQVV
ncbi:hypothetical protein P170DRAFT_240243 [Aspergillus steynii IBT 23096]|uniref:Uncharacterized protein n=1 Tax=Aspergillus steynii IBT 23096 TaxID=1392250 RepID=A0A2I2G3G7_9EURO|nr:uncharacterized protein P170DRAFT_240243 [Aspergillus steynii IBT 23096]PLB47397.1 hypothetical protein P170DRAFT_240243 [Aspergillus steynii IBT 23096]